jgi:hypothetical protein
MAISIFHALKVAALAAFVGVSTVGQAFAQSISAQDKESPRVMVYSDQTARPLRHALFSSMTLHIYPLSFADDVTFRATSNARWAPDLQPILQSVAERTFRSVRSMIDVSLALMIALIGWHRRSGLSRWWAVRRTTLQ